MTAWATTVPVWTALTAYLAGARVQPTAQDNTVQVVTTAGTSGAAEPTWSTSEPWTTTDGTVTWTKGSSARRQMVSGLYATLKAFQAANPTMLLDVSAVRPQALAGLALPAVYLGARDESITVTGQIVTRTFQVAVHLVDIAPSSSQYAAREDDLVDGLEDWLSSRYHAASGFSIVGFSSALQLAEGDGSTTYPETVMVVTGTVAEGRS